MSIVAVGSTLYASLYPQGDSTGHPIFKSTNGGTSWSPPSAPNGFAIHGFVQVGKGNEGALGGYVYGLVGGWSGLTTVKLVRVPASSVQNPSAYHWFSGSPSNATWSSSSGSARAIASDSAGMGRPNMTWVPAVGRYLLTASHARSATGSFPKVSVFESPNMWGPWKTVHYDDKFLSASGGMKGNLARLGIRGFKPTLRKAPERLEALHTPEGPPLPPNTAAELRRDMARLRVVAEQIKEIEAARLEQLEREPGPRPHAMVRLLARVVGIGVETADMLVHEVLSRDLRDRRAVARYAGLTGAPDESGAKRREKGLAKAGNARVRRGMIQLAWRFLLFQKDSALARWYRARTEGARGGMRKTLIVALARKLLIALWRLVTTGETPEGLVLRPVG